MFVDRATRYIWIFGLKSLHADALILAFSQFRAEAGRLATHFRTDCDAKLLSHQAVSWLRENCSDIASAIILVPRGTAYRLHDELYSR